MKKSFVVGHIYDIVSLNKGHLCHMRAKFIGTHEGCYTFFDYMNRKSEWRIPHYVAFLSVIDRTPDALPTGYNEEEWRQLPPFKRREILSQHPYAIADLNLGQNEYSTPRPNGPAFERKARHSPAYDALPPLLLTVSRNEITNGHGRHIEVHSILAVRQRP